MSNAFTNDEYINQRFYIIPKVPTQSTANTPAWFTINNTHQQSDNLLWLSLNSHQPAIKNFIYYKGYATIVPQPKPTF
jgi:hypothetical protein